VERGREQQPPRERRETRGCANELGLGLGACLAGTVLYIGREGRPGSNDHREGGRDPIAIVSGVVPAVGAGRARVVLACWDSSPTRAWGLGRSWHERAWGWLGRVVRGSYLNGPCSCWPNGLSPFEHL
jgi:hypothetical protein